MPTVVTVINLHTEKHYAIRIPPVIKGEIKICSIYLLSYSKDTQEVAETFVEKYTAAEDATLNDILEKGREIVNSYRD